MPDQSPSQRVNDELLLSSSPVRSTGDAEGEWSAYHDENEVARVSFGMNEQKTPVSKISATALAEQDGSLLITPPDSGSQLTSKSNSQAFSHEESTIPSSFQFSFGAQASTSISRNWEARARSASPAATLARHATQGREKKKTQFLDRIRRRRDDARSEDVGDQVLRMDYVRERRDWEREMQRCAEAEAGVQDEGEVDMLVEEEEEARAHGGEELSPTEDHDLDELAQYYEDIRRGSGSGEDEFPVDDADVEEYERLFGQVLLQQQQIRQTTTIRTGQEQRQEYARGMDLS